MYAVVKPCICICMATVLSRKQVGVLPGLRRACKTVHFHVGCVSGNMAQMWVCSCSVSKTQMRCLKMSSCFASGTASRCLPRQPGHPIGSWCISCPAGPTGRCWMVAMDTIQHLGVHAAGCMCQNHTSQPFSKVGNINASNRRHMRWGFTLPAVFICGAWHAWPCHLKGRAVHTSQ